jgi:DNA invertase Pin-like site-specific DNA recombinase
MNIGYARVSTKEQNLNLQIDALSKAGCKIIFQEKASGRKVDRPELEKLLSQIRPKDVLIVYSLDRLGRTIKQLIDLINDFKSKGIQFKSLTEGSFDTTSAMGEAIFQIMAILKAMEVNLLRERTMKGLQAARARGRKGGRPVGSFNKIKSEAAASLYKKQKPITDILKTLQISRATLYEYLKREGVNYDGFKKNRKK